jgi:putative transposase
VTWDGRGASEDGEERGAAHLPARGVPAAGQGSAGRREAYRALFKAHLDDALVERIREATNGNYAVGDRRFQAEIEQALGRRVTKSTAGRPKAQPEHRRGQLGLLWNRGLSLILASYSRLFSGKYSVRGLS